MRRSSTIAALSDCLRAEGLAYGDLIASADQHLTALLAGETQAMEASLNRQLAALSQCREATLKRQDLTKTLSLDLGLGEPCSTGRLLAALPEGDLESLRREHSALKEMSAALRERNARNRRLVEHRLDLLQGDFSALAEFLAAVSPVSASAGPAGEGNILSTRA